MSLKRPLKVFLSYCRKDDRYRNELCKQLRVCELEGLLQIWYDKYLRPGEEWEPELLQKLDEADIIVLIVTTDFFNSQFCYLTEFKRAQERHNQGTCRIIPVYARPCLLTEDVKKFTILPGLRKSIKEHSNQDQAFMQVAEAIQDEAEALCNPVSAESRWSRARFIEGQAKPVSRIPLDLAYLCDRNDQQDHLQLRLNELRSPNSPVIIILCGNRSEEHEFFFDRIRRSPLPDLLGMKGKPDFKATPVELKPTKEIDLSKLLSARVARSLDSVTVVDPVLMASKLQKGLNLVPSFLSVTNWPDDLDFLHAYLDYWGTWPQLPPDRALVVTISVKHESQCPSAGRIQEQLQSRRHENIRLVVLDELQEVTRQQAINWADHLLVRSKYHWPDEYPALVRDIEDIFRERPQLPMKDVADQLIKLIERYQ